MTDDGTWKPIPGYPAYEASDTGPDPVDRPDGRGAGQLKGRILTARVSNSGYLLVNRPMAAG